jgi:flavonoid 3'-monooxygenase
MIGRRVFDDGKGGCDPRADEFKAMVVELMVLAGVFNIGDFIPSLEWLDLQGVQAKMKKLHKRFDAFLTSIIEEHKSATNKSDEKHKDLLSTLLSLKDVPDDDENKLTDTEIKALLLVPTLSIFFSFFPFYFYFLFYFFFVNGTYLLFL